MLASLDPNICHRALRARDRRFDGLFFVGVATTGIYCRPICPARTPRQDRCEYFALAAEAERASFRACLRCRPELAPGHASTDARSRVVAAALHHIERGALAEDGVEALAARLGVSSRHLRRTIEAELGVTPLELEATRRLALGKQLLQDTRLPLAQIAFAAGFGSVRRFNAVFAKRFGRAPSDVRRASAEATPLDDGAIGFRLAYRPPYAWPSLRAFLGARAVPGVERVADGEYARTVAVGDVVGQLRVSASTTQPEFLLQLSPSLAPHVAQVVRSVRDLFDLDARPDVITDALASDPELAPLVRALPGLRVPGAFDPFEVAVRAVLAQQISVAGATTLSGRVARTFGLAVEQGDRLCRVAPTADSLARASIESLRAIGIPEARARALSSLARAVADGSIDLHARAERSNVIARLLRLPGIGPFTAHVIAMRVLRDPDAFPENDLLVKRRLGARPTARAERWRPFRAYAVMHIWEEAGAKR